MLLPDKQHLIVLCALFAGLLTDDTRPVVNVLCIAPRDQLFIADPDSLIYSFRYVNNNLSSLFPTFQLQYTMLLTDGQALGGATKAFIDGYLQPPNKALILGAGYSSQSQVVADIAKFYFVPQIGYSNASPGLSDRTLYPYYIRLSITTKLYIEPAVEMLKRFKWRKFGLISIDNDAVYPVTLELETFLQKQNLTSYQKVTYSTDPTSSLISLLNLDLRIFLVVRSAPLEAVGKRFECVVQKLGAYGPKYMYIQFGFPFTHSVISGSCPDSYRAQSLEGSVELDNYVLDANTVESSVGPAGKNLSVIFADFLSQYPRRGADAVPRTVMGFNMRFDAVLSTALALNATLAVYNYTTDLQLANSSFKAALFQNIRNLNFMGLSGNVVFDSIGDRSSLIMLYQIRNLTRQLVATYDPVLKNMIWLKDIWFAAGTPPVDEPQIISRTLSISNGTAVAVILIATLGILLAIVTMSVNLHYRSLRLIKLSSPYVNTAIGAGCIMCYASCIVMAYNSLWVTDVGLCWLQGILLAVGYSFAYGAMLAKTWRVHRIFTNRKVRRLAVKDWQLFAVILVVAATDLVIFALWGAIDPLYLNYNMLPLQERPGDGIIIRTSLLECSSNSKMIWIGAIIGVKGFLLIFGIFFAWETRTVQVEALNDSKKIGVCVYNTMVMGAIGVVLAFVLPPSSLDLRILLISVCVIVSATTTVLIVFGSKIFMLIKQGPSQVDDLQTAMQTVAGVVMGGSSVD